MPTTAFQGIHFIPLPNTRPSLRAWTRVLFIGTNLKRKALCLALFLYTVFIAPTSATIITFDELHVSQAIPVPRPYNGLMWTNFYPSATNWFGTSDGFANAFVSGFVFNGDGGTAVIASALFNLNGGYLAAAYRDDLQLKVEGFLNGSLLYSNTYVLGTASGTTLNFNYQGVDKVVFSASGGTPHPGYSDDGTYFGIDYLDVTILHDALINSQPVSCSATAGDSVSFSVSAYGAPPFAYQWFFDGSTIDGSTNTTLTITNVQSWNQGEYKVVVSGLLSSVASSNALLSVVPSPPIILKQPMNATVLSGGSANFAVSAKGSLPFTYQWQFNGSNIVNATDATLTLTNLTSSDAGAYTVIVSNSHGSAPSSDAILTLSRSVVVAWGGNFSGQTNVPSTLTNVIEVAACHANSMALKEDGTIVGWGANGWGQTTPPVGLSNVVAIATGGVGSYPFSQALKSDGTVFGWGNNAMKQAIPPAGLSNVVAIAAGFRHSLALRNDGSVVAWGDNTYKQTNVPPDLTNAVAISSGSDHSVALRNNGVPTSWGSYSGGKTNVPLGLTNVTAVACGFYHSLALKNDGTIVGWGDNTYKQSSVPPGLSNIIAIAAGDNHSLAIRDDGTVVAWGDNSAGQTNVPSGLRHVTSLAGGSDHSLALAQDGPPVIFAQPASQTNFEGLTSFLSGRASGLRPLQFQWLFNGTNLIAATNATLKLGPLQPNMAGTYRLVCSNAMGSVSSSNAVITVISVLTNPPFLTLQPTTKVGIFGSNVTFSVSVAPGPIPNYQWQFNGTNLINATNATLLLTNVQAPHEGYYSVVVKNDFGTTVSSNAFLAVMALDFPTALNTSGLAWTNVGNVPWFPQIDNSHDGFQAAQSGAAAPREYSILRTTVTGPGTLTFWWKLSPKASYPWSNTLRLSSSLGSLLGSVTPTAEWEQSTMYLGPGLQDLDWSYYRGSYVSQSTGWVDQVSFTPGGTPPTIAAMTPNIFVRANAYTTLTVSAYGTPPLAYQWKFNGTDLADKTNAYLNLSGLELVNAGVYTVTITNAFGTAATNTTLWVGHFGFRASPTNVLISTNGFHLTLDGVLTTNPVVIFGSTNLLNWVPLFTNSATTGSVHFLDFTATNLPARFYRAQE